MPHEVIMPALGMAQDSGLLVSWLKQPGDAVKIGDALMEVETDKATMEVEAQADGFLAKVQAAAGEQVPVGQVVAIITDSAEEAEAASPTESGPAPQDGPAASATSPTENDDLPSGAEIIMPALGMAQDTGLIVAWRKEPGEPVAADAILFEVETDKSVVEVAAGHDGFLAAVLAEAQQAVPVGAVIAIISETAPEAPVKRTSAAAPAASQQAKPATADASADPVARKKAPSPEPEARMATPSTGRILASPKARRLAAERGLDLARLAQTGVAPPYHVADLTVLENLGPRAPGVAEGTAVSGPVSSHISARVSAQGCTDFLDWAKSEAGSEVAADRLFASFAAAALRQARSEARQPIIVTVRRAGQNPVRFSDADCRRLSQSAADEGEEPPALVVRDMTGSKITAMSGMTGSVPTLTLGRDGSDFVLSLDYSAGALDEDQAVELVSSFAERLGEPLRHLL
ncbi:biotin/lipoyl-containing protein [Pseudohoeflea coraliihabitans]|uniref:Lipoyl-binding domain-containing protein n=1 Tax=Pseudohoeflea coraliihabitans TaxID=2860393 RepID=A0ABS6WSV8_9HYPH|nr:biotin/lipoyl-containing protein [Pseudohoeflea sp. DP4N28-3]MBW3099025.1 hypothetical protein [Pseudohoeflea sp. DP4N28-3]